MQTTGTLSHTILKVNGQQWQQEEDTLAVEDPLQIQVQIKVQKIELKIKKMSKTN